MPVVFVTDAPTASGHKYNDVLGKQYEFPQRYRNLVHMGDTFIYYRGSRGSADGSAGYFGAGVVGIVRESSDPTQLVAEVHDVELFDEPVPIKNPDGAYWETGSAKRTNWQNGVRRISDDVLSGVQSAAAVPAWPLAPLASPGSAFASPAHASALERYSVRVAMELLADEFGAAAVKEMPPGNPGYDVVVERAGADLHVEVKGTILPDPVFHLSEGQRQHAAALRADFRLVVVYQVSLGQGTHKVVVMDGPLDSAKVDLQPEAWTGRALPRSTRNELAPQPRPQARRG